MSSCGCKPGTYDNGWMEERCAECIEVESRAWRGITERAREYADILRKKDKK